MARLFWKSGQAAFLPGVGWVDEWLCRSHLATRRRGRRKKGSNVLLSHYFLPLLFHVACSGYLLGAIYFFVWGRKWTNGKDPATVICRSILPLFLQPNLNFNLIFTGFPFQVLRGNGLEIIGSRDWGQFTIQRK